MQLIKSQGFEVDLLTRKKAKEVKAWLESKPFLVGVLFYAESIVSRYEKDDFKLELKVTKLAKASKVNQLTLTGFLKKSYPDRRLANTIIKNVTDYEKNLPTSAMKEVDKMTNEIIEYFTMRDYDIEGIFDDKKILKEGNATFKTRLDLASKYMDLLRFKDRLKKP